MKIKRVRRVFSDPAGDCLISRYEVSTAAGVTFTVSAHRYSQGPSMVDWELAGPALPWAGYDEGISELCNRKRECIMFITELPERPA